MDNNFYKMWDEYARKYSQSHEVAVLVPLCGHFILRGDIFYLYEPHTVAKHGNWIHGTVCECSKNELAEMDKAIEMATGIMSALPNSPLYQEIRIMHGNGRGKWIVDEVTCPSIA